MAKLEKGINDLLTLHPDIAKEWDYERNGDINPSDVTSGSKKKIWWKCSTCGNEWEAVIYSRAISGSGCPICSRKKQGVSFRRQRIAQNGSLKETHPILCLEWDYSKNNDILPEEFSFGSNRKVWWRCIKGHEWESTINSRAQGCGCPKCNSGYRVSLPEKAIVYYLKQYVDVQENVRLFDNSLRDVDIYIPRYNYAIEYDGEHWHKSKKKDLEKTELCKENGVKLIRIREPKAGLLNDNYSVEYITETPKNDLNYLNESILWLLKLIGINNADVDSNRDMPKIRSMINRSYYEDSFGYLYPELSSEWDNEKNGELSPFDVSKSSGLKIWWRCVNNHSWQDTVAHRISDRGCPYCSGHRTLSGFNDLETRYPSIAKEWDYDKNNIIPSKISFRNGRKVWWLCQKGHSYQTTVAHRTEDGTGCPYCSNQKVLVGYNDLLTVEPNIVKEWNYSKNRGLSPQDYVIGSNKKVWWKCSICGHEWQAQIYSRTINETGCPICGAIRGGQQHRKSIINKKGSLQDLFPELVMEWDYDTNCGKSPNDYSAGSNENVYWKCKKCGNTWSAKISNRTILHRGCPKCAVEERSRKKSKMVKCIDNDMLFDSVNAASEYAQVSASKISACCRGKQKTAGGYHWEYYDSRD